MAEARTPLLLLHGVTSSAHAWDRVLPLLKEYEPIVPTALGHRGGAPLVGPATIERLVDHTERQLDALGLGRVHVAGNSMGGWMALELARRGRARSVCALSPAGAWAAGSPAQHRGRLRIQRGRRAAMLFRPAAGVFAGVPALRRVMFRDAAVRGDRLTREQSLDLLDDLVECTAAMDLLQTSESLQPLPEPGCPVTLAWAERDRIFPVDVNGARARTLVPDAVFKVLPGVGHVPMYDDPELTAATITEAIRLAEL